MSVTDIELKIINLSCKRYDLIKTLKKAKPENKRIYEKEIERINMEIERLLKDGNKHKK